MIRQISSLASQAIPLINTGPEYTLPSCTADLVAAYHARKTGENRRGSIPSQSGKPSEKQAADEHNRRVIESLNPVLSQKQFDASEYAISLLPRQPESVTDTQIEEILREQNEIIDVVMIELSSKIINSYEDVVGGIVQIQKLGSELQEAVEISRVSRSNLKGLENGPLKDHARILTQYRKRQYLAKIIEELEVIELSCNIEKQLSIAMDTGDFEQGISLVEKVKNSADILAKYQSTKSISHKLTEATSFIENSLRTALSAIYRSFDKDRYVKIFHSYKRMNLLTEFVKIMQQLAIEVVDNVARESVFYFVLNTAATPEAAEQLKKTAFEGLCFIIPVSSFLKCFKQLLGVFVDLMYSFINILRWHKEYEQSDGANDEILAYDLIRTSIPLIWDEMQRKVSTMLMKAQHRVRSLQVDEYLQVFNGMNTFINFGKEFSERSSTPLFSSVYNQTKDYFESFHHQNVELIRTLLDNELWQPCPVPVNYSFRDIAEIATFLATKKEEKEDEDEGHSFFAQYELTGNPFLKRKKAISLSRVAEEDEENDPALHGKDSEQANVSASSLSADYSSPGKYLTSTANTFVKILGRYFQMMRTFPHIAHDIANGVARLVYLFGYSTYSVFVPMSEATGPVVPLELLGCLQNIYEQLSQQPWWKPLEVKSGLLEDATRLPKPMLIGSKATPLSAGNVQSIIERLVGAESLPFILDVIESCRHMIEDLLPRGQMPSWSLFIKQMNTLYRGLREHLYRLVCYQLNNMDKYVGLINNCKWDVEEFDKTNPYVESILKDMKDFQQKLNTDLASRVPESCIKMIWMATASDTMEVFVEGFSRVKKCTNAGRNAMMNDFRAFCRGIEKLVLVTIPNTGYVEDYLAAFYYNEKDFLDWSRKRTNYTHKQLTSLASLGCGASMSIRARSDFLDGVKRTNPNPQIERKFVFQGKMFPNAPMNIFK